MTDAEVDKILELAESSVFYKNSDGVFRIQYTDITDGFFAVIDEETEEESNIYPEDVKVTDAFYKTVMVPVSEILTQQSPST